MIEKGLYDPYSLSCLMKNEYVNFEQVLRFAVENEATDNKDERINFITMNQLMGKAETLSDADMCMRLMGITDCNPCKLRDENALVAYLQIRGVDFRKCIEIIKGRRLLYPDVLSDNAISAILNKFNICQLVDVFFPSGQNPVPGYYQERYGFLDEEIMKMRKNAIHINKLFFKANAVSGRPEIIRLIEDKFNDIKKSDELRFLISDPEKNGNNGILSVYMKNKDIFKSYKDLVDFYDGLPENCKPVNVDNNIYSVFLWKIVDRYNNRHCDRTKAIEMLNEKLIEAYKEFAKRYPKDKVMEMMPKLYRYRPLLADESTFDKEEKYAYEDQELSMTFTGYLDYLIKYNPAFVDGTFIFNALTMMRNGIASQALESGNAESSVTPLKRCWPLLEKEGKIDVFELLGPDETTKAEISAAMDLPENKWILDANVQTFSYFAEYSPNLISMMDSRFDGNFTYDDSGRKSCLKYALKNYALSYKKHKEADEECVRRELEYIIRQILTRENNKAIFRGVCKIKYSAIDREKSVEGAFWEDLSKSREFRNALVRHNSIWKKKPKS